MAYQYLAVCIFDFILAPLLQMALGKYTGTYVQWDPITLKESGFYHLSMGAIVGVAAWTRGMEKIRRLDIDGETETPVEPPKLLTEEKPTISPMGKDL